MSEQTNSNDAVRVALESLMQSPHWAPFEASIRERRETWIVDTRSPTIYQNHAELVNTTARVAECDWLLETFEECRRRKYSDPALSS